MHQLFHRQSSDDRREFENLQRNIDLKNKINRQLRDLEKIDEEKEIQKINNNLAKEAVETNEAKLANSDHKRCGSYEESKDKPNTICKKGNSVDMRSEKSQKSRKNKLSEFKVRLSGDEENKNNKVDDDDDDHDHNDKNNNNIGRR